MAADTPATQHGYLVLADISGFTSYLAGVELDHAHEILCDLLETIVESFKPTLTFAKLEGDAVFAYAPESRLPRGEALLELLEATYVAFRGRAEATRRRTTCECNACKSISKLDLKFITHHGDYIIQRVAGGAELLGSDVNLAHRLLKNQISQATGWRAYALFTTAALTHMGCRPEGLHPSAEHYEYLGQVETFSLDLHPRYAELTEARRAFITPEQAHFTVTGDYAAPPPVVWEWLNDPHKIIQWSPHRHMRPGLRPQGRLGVGARNHCLHGKKESMVETILDWRPFDYFTVKQDSHILPGSIGITSQLEPIAGGTRLRVYFTFTPKLFRALGPLMCRAMIKMFGMEAEFDSLTRLIAETPQPEASAA